MPHDVTRDAPTVRAAATWAERLRQAASGRALPDLRQAVPPPRFGRTTFEAFEATSDSTVSAREQVRAAVDDAMERERRSRRRHARPFARFTTRWRSRGGERPGGGLYLDGGFGVGKTHLLAAAWHAAELPASAKRYLSFQELVHAIGVLGRAGTRDAFRGSRLLCLDEFELDDPGNTLMIATFLSERFAEGSVVITTSNTPPDRQGEGRFAAEDFRREIQGLADAFTVVRLDGPDRRVPASGARWSTAEERSHALREGPGDRAYVSGEALDRALAELHPVRYGTLLHDVGTLVIENLARIPHQHQALRFVHLIDKAYDLGVRLRASGSLPPAELFDPSYARSAYAKKHDRCLSRLAEMLLEPLQARM